MSKKPMMSRPTFIAIVMAETLRGRNSLSTIARPAALPTVTWLGIIKKNTAQAVMIVPTVMLMNSRILRLLSMARTSFQIDY